MLRIYLLTLLQSMVPGAGIAIIVFIVSLFKTGNHAEFLRLFSLDVFLIMLTLGILRVIWLFIKFRLNR
jgi:hypothetical protein